MRLPVLDAPLAFGLQTLVPKLIALTVVFLGFGRKWEHLETGSAHDVFPNKSAFGSSFVTIRANVNVFS